MVRATPSLTLQSKVTFAFVPQNIEAQEVVEHRTAPHITNFTICFFINLILYFVAADTRVAIIKIKRAWCRMPHSKSKVLGKPNARI